MLADQERKIYNAISTLLRDKKFVDTMKKKYPGAIVFMSGLLENKEFLPPYDPMNSQSYKAREIR